MDGNHVPEGIGMENILIHSTSETGKMVETAERRVQHRREHLGWKRLIQRLAHRLDHVIPYAPKSKTSREIRKLYKDKAERKAYKKEHVKELKALGGRHVPHEIHREKEGLL